MTLEKIIAKFQKLGIDVYTVDQGKRRTLIRVQTLKDRIDLISDIQYAIRDSVFYTKSSYSSIGHLDSEGTIIIVKPLKGATENLHIKAAGMAAGGDIEFVEPFGECFSFSSWSQIAASILDHLSENQHVGQPVYDAMSEYFADFWDRPERFFWNADVLPTEKNELGKYMGELLIGMYAFRNKVEIARDPVKFLVPTSSCYSGIDCAIMLSDSRIIPISNKYGAGAKASFFTNLLPLIASNRKKVKPAWALYPVLSALDEIGDPRKAKEIVYTYGVKTELGLTEIVDPYADVFRAIVAGKRSTSSIRSVVAAIKTRTDRQAIIERLNPRDGFSSITGFFTRRIAQNLNGCAKSMAFMKSLVAGKDFWQVNLDRKAWSEGQVQFDYLASGDAQLYLMGDKATLSDITAKQGLVNYELYYEKSPFGAR